MIARTLKRSIEKMLDSCPDYYGVESESVRGLYYVMDGEKFACCRGKDAILCTTQEMPELAEYVLNKAMKKEVLDLYEDLKDLLRMDMRLTGTL